MLSVRQEAAWLDIVRDIPFDMIWIKVVDGEIVFPMEAKGRIALAQGTVEKNNKGGWKIPPAFKKHEKRAFKEALFSSSAITGYSDRSSWYQQTH